MTYLYYLDEVPGASQSPCGNYHVYMATVAEAVWLTRLIPNLRPLGRLEACILGYNLPESVRRHCAAKGADAGPFAGFLGYMPGRTLLGVLRATRRETRQMLEDLEEVQPVAAGGRALT